MCCSLLMTHFYLKLIFTILTKPIISLQADLDKTQKFGDRWWIIFSSSKTVQQTFTNRTVKNYPKLRFGNLEIPVESSHKHLGLMLSSSLRFHDHVNDVVKKVNAALGPLYPAAKYVPRNILNQIYCTYVRETHIRLWRYRISWQLNSSRYNETRAITTQSCAVSNRGPI